MPFVKQYRRRWTASSPILDDFGTVVIDKFVYALSIHRESPVTPEGVCKSYVLTPENFVKYRNILHDDNFNLYVRDISGTFYTTGEITDGFKRSKAVLSRTPQPLSLYPR